MLNSADIRLTSDLNLISNTEMKMNGNAIHFIRASLGGFAESRDKAKSILCPR